MPVGGLRRPRQAQDGQQVCVDYGALSSCTYKDTYPVRHTNVRLDALNGASWFGTLDLCAGYHDVCHTQRVDV